MDRRGGRLFTQHFFTSPAAAGGASLALLFAVRGCVDPKGRVLSITVLAGWQMAVKRKKNADKTRFG